MTQNSVLYTTMNTTKPKYLDANGLLAWDMYRDCTGDDILLGMIANNYQRWVEVRDFLAVTGIVYQHNGICKVNPAADLEARYEQRLAKSISLLEDSVNSQGLLAQLEAVSA